MKVGMNGYPITTITVTNIIAILQTTNISPPPIVSPVLSSSPLGGHGHIVVVVVVNVVVVVDAEIPYERRRRAEHLVRVLNDARSESL